MKGKRILLSGATGGIGSQVASLMSGEGARLCITGLDNGKLQTLKEFIAPNFAHIVAGNICDSSDRARMVSEAQQHLGGIDILINVAGINPFGVYAEQDEAIIQKTLEVNTIGPMLLTHAVLPTMLEQNSGHIVNIGSTFGSIGFAWFSAYSASKFALRGFSQSLRRELAETGIKVSYIAPRAVKTAINSQGVYDMANAVKMNMDEPDAVARQIVASIKRGDKERYLGFPESLFVRINAVLPGLVDRATRKQNIEAHEFAAKKS